MSPGRSLRDWLGTFESQHPEHVRTVHKTLSPYDYELVAVLEALERRGDSSVVVFESTTDLTGEPSMAGWVMNSYASQVSLNSVAGGDAASGEASWAEFLQSYARRLKRGVPPTVVDGPVPVHDNVVTGADLDLRRLPWARHIAGEGGPYFTPIQVSRDPVSGRYNLSWNRVMMLDSRHAAIHISPRDLWSFHHVLEQRGEDLPLAMVLGHHPGFNLAGATLATGDDEYEVAGAIIGEPVRLCPSITFGEDLLVPADAEIVIEGRLLANQRTVEGPFGEFMLYLGPQKISHVFEVTAITWRNDPLVLGVFACHPDHLNAHVAIEASLLEKVSASVPQVKSISWFHGGGPTTLVVQLAKSTEGQPMRAALSAISASNFIKQVIVVDEDVDPEDSHEVMWAVSTRVDAGRDVVTIEGVQGGVLDPSVGHDLRTTALVIDATVPLRVPYPERGRVPEEAVGLVDLTTIFD